MHTLLVLNLHSYIALGDIGFGEVKRDLGVVWVTYPGVVGVGFGPVDEVNETSLRPVELSGADGARRVNYEHYIVNEESGPRWGLAFRPTQLSRSSGQEERHQFLSRLF